jgi:hypothetical protein
MMIAIACWFIVLLASIVRCPADQCNELTTPRRNFAEATMLVLHVFGLLGAEAHGPIAIGALVLIVLLLTLPVWLR